jgi:hypothetical protein
LSSRLAPLSDVPVEQSKLNLLFAQSLTTVEG